MIRGPQRVRIEAGRAGRAGVHAYGGPGGRPWPGAGVHGPGADRGGPFTFALYRAGAGRAGRASYIGPGRAFTGPRAGGPTY